MTRCVVDTNVPIVANGRPDPEDPRPPSVGCRRAAVSFLMDVVTNGTILLDTDGAVQAEYRRHLHPRGQPGVGDRFYQVVLHSAPLLVERVELPRNPDGEYMHLPRPLVDVGFDPSDRKFAAIAHKEQVPVVNATDSDWVEHGPTLAAVGVGVHHLCGNDRDQWFVGEP